ncbi:MAG TPA: peptidoglycan-binding protein [Terriglobia bacterium]|nr:peptidoglycan-binding protein [Terriglobia bacterium]
MKLQHRPALVLVLAVASVGMGLRCWPVEASTTKLAAKHPPAHSAHASTTAHKARVRVTHHKGTSSSKTTARGKPSSVHKTSIAARRGKRGRAKPLRSTAYTRLARMQMDPARVESIQEALINAGAFHGAPTGQWDSATRDAMAHYQAENGFGVTGLPDAKSLMKLGLGPHPLPPELNKTAARSIPASPPTAASDGSAAPSSKPASDPAITPVAPPSGGGPER